MRPKALATFSATPSWGQSWRAISKVRAWRVSRLGEDLERLEAIVENLFLGTRGRWPIAGAFLSVRHKKARPGRPAPEGPERMRRAAEGGEFASRGIRLWPKGKFVKCSRCWPNGLGLRPRTTEGNALAMGFSCGPFWREKKVLRNGRRAEPATSLPKIRTCFCRPILMVLLFCPTFASAYESAENVASRETASSSTTMTWVAPRGAHALMRMAVVGRSTTRRSIALC